MQTGKRGRKDMCLQKFWREKHNKRQKVVIDVCGTGRKHHASLQTFVTHYSEQDNDRMRRTYSQVSPACRQEFFLAVKRKGVENIDL